MFPRRQKVPARSFFLFGPRATGKTTWLREVLGGARWYNLLHDKEMVRLVRDPGLLAREVEALPKKSWVVIDEVQKVPPLLDEVHDLISRRQDLRFAITGSSARKLKRGQANLLAGRAVTRLFFPLVAEERGYAEPIEALLRFGCLPQICGEPEEQGRVDLLEAYGETYLAEEIRAEALVKNLGSFARFLEVAALTNGQVTNISSIARDAGVPRPTVQGYFEVLIDTLVASRLPAYRPRARVKEGAHPKFYFFDTGVVRSLSRRLREPLEAAERGPLLETYVLHELRAYITHSECGGELSYWRTPSGGEVDFVWSRGTKHVAIEVKASERWRTEDGRSIKDLAGHLGNTRALVVFLGKTRQKDGPLEILPLMEFLQRLARGGIIG